MRRVLVGLRCGQLGDGRGGRGLDVWHGQGCWWQGLLPWGLLGLQGGRRVSRRLGGSGREAKRLRGARVLQQGLQAVRAGWALAMQGLTVGWARGLPSGPSQRLQRGMR